MRHDHDRTAGAGDRGAGHRDAGRARTAVGPAPSHGHGRARAGRARLLSRAGRRRDLRLPAARRRPLDSRVRPHRRHRGDHLHVRRWRPPRARVELRFPPRAGAPADPRALAEATARTLVDQVPGAALRGSGRALPIPGGASWGVAVSAEVQGAPIVAGAVAIADGDAAVAVVTIAHAPLYDDPAVAPVLDAIYQGVRVGGKVLTPPPAQPGRARAGVYLGLGNQLGEYHARIFDPRGYVYDDASVALDLDARYQRARGQADRYVATADAIRVTGADGRSGDELEVRADALALDGHVLCPVAATDGRTLEGSWTAASFTTAPGPHTTFAASTSSRYAFTRDGRFRPRPAPARRPATPRPARPRSRPATTAPIAGATRSRTISSR